MFSKEQRKDLDELLGLIRKHIQGPGGFISDIEQYNIIDNQKFTDFKNALELLQIYWKDQIEIEKSDVLPLCDIIPHLNACWLMHPEKQIEIKKTIDCISKCINKIFKNPQIYEYSLLFDLENQFTGSVPSLATELHFGRIEEGRLDYVIYILEELKDLWKNKKTISKEAAQILMHAQDFIWKIEGRYEETELIQLLKIEDKIILTVRELLK